MLRLGAVQVSPRLWDNSGMTDESPTSPEFPPDWLQIESLDIEAQGIAHRADGKVVFVEGALPFELVSANVNRKKNNWEKATLMAIHR